MPILTSPGVAIQEKDYSQIVAFGAIGAAALAGEFSCGPIHQPVLLTTPDDLELYFGKPTETNYKEWYCAWNFLQYASKLWVTRIKPTNVSNAVTTPASSTFKGTFSATTAYTLGDIVIGSNGKYYRATVTDTDVGDDPVVSGASGSADNSWAVLGIEALNAGEFEMISDLSKTQAGQLIAKAPGAIGNGLEVFIVDSATWTDFNSDNYKSEGKRIASYMRTGAPNTSSFVVTAANNDAANDEVHVVVVDKTGIITGVAGRIIELWEGLSKCSNATDYLGRPIFYKTFLNMYSEWVYFGSFPQNLSSGADEVSWGVDSSSVPAGKSFKTLTTLVDSTFTGGNDGSLKSLDKIDALKTGYDFYVNKEEYDVSYFITVDYDVTVQKYVAQSIAEVRRDSIAFISPHDDGVPFLNKSSIVQDLLTYRGTTLNLNSSYAVLDSGYKYQYDGYNKKYRWVPLNGDIAGLCSRLDAEYEAWFSPGGFTRGQIKNCLKLSSNLPQAARDQLYPKQVNAVVSFPAKGVVLFGDRTMQSKTSAFQSIHIRKLFIILEKAIEDSAKYQLFELNNTNTRNRFVGMVEPFLRSVQSREGLDDFRVVCNASNNPDDAVARGEFTADIYVKPLYSIQFIILNFVATKSSIQFNTSVAI